MFSDLAKYAGNRYSQTGEDGVIRRIFDLIGETNRFAIEFGGGDGYSLSNTRALLDAGWTGFMLEGNPKHAGGIVKNEFVTAENINDLLDKYGAPAEPDLMSVDIDGNDYWVWKAITRRPRLLVIEFNAAIEPGLRLTVPYDPGFIHDRTDYYGASLEALRSLGKQKGYSLVHRTDLNCFFVPSELVPVCPTVTYERFQGHPHDQLGRPWVTV